MKEIIYASWERLNQFLYFDDSCFENKKLISKNISEKKVALIEEILTSKDMNHEELLKLINKIDINPEVKKINDKNEVEYNFFISMPIELWIIDCVWASLVSLKYGNNNDSYGARVLEKRVEKSKLSIGILGKRDRRFFERYVYGYNDWIRKASNSLEEVNEVGGSLVQIDLKRCFYRISNVYDTFKDLHEYFPLVERDIVYKIYKISKLINDEYSNKLLMYYEGPQGTTPLPLGLMSSRVMVNHHLEGFDNLLKKQFKTVFYGRYIDDIIMVTKGIYNNDTTKVELENILNSIVTVKYSKLTYNQDKVQVQNTQMPKFYFNSINQLKNMNRYSVVNEVSLDRELLVDNYLPGFVENFDDLLKLDADRLIYLVNYIFRDVSFSRRELEKLREKFNKFIESKDFLPKKLLLEFSKYNSVFQGDNHRLFSLVERKLKHLDTDYITSRNYSKFKRNYISFVSDLRNGLIERKSYKYKSLADLKYQITSSLDTNTNYVVKHFVQNLDNNHSIRIHKKFQKSNYDFVSIDYYKEKVKSGLSSYKKDYLILDEKKDNPKTDVVQYNVSFKGKSIDDYIDKTPSTQELIDFLRLLQEVKKIQPRMFLLPECYLSYSFINLMYHFSRTTQITIVTGMRLRYESKKLVNRLLTLIPYKSKAGRKVCVPIVREKNDYSPIEFTATYTPKNSVIPTYINYDLGDFKFTNLLCFEATDLKARGLYKGETDMVNIPMLNGDSAYFDSISYALSRDLSCEVICTNSSSWGNSLIAEPKEIAKRKRTSFSGADNEFLVYTDLELHDLIKYNRVCRNCYKNDCKTAVGCTLHKSGKKMYKPHPARF